MFFSNPIDHTKRTYHRVHIIREKEGEGIEPIEFPKFTKLRGKKAIKGLYDFISELEEQRGVELTDKQTTALIKLAEALISSIDAEMRSTSTKGIRFERYSWYLEPKPLLYYPNNPLHDAMRRA